MSLTSAVIGKINRFQRNVSQRWREKRVPGAEIGERIRIFDLVCPLRYDILVRAQYIMLIAENDDPSADVLESSADNRAARAYRTWFKEVEIRRFYPELYRDEQRIRERLERRIRNLRKLWLSIRERGFDPGHPIRLMSGRKIRAVNGKTVGTTLFAGGGCHRIACLLVMGKNFLEPTEYEVAFVSDFVPLDNTALLLESLPISMRDYMSFISDGYCAGTAIATVDEALDYIRKHSPDRISELKSVFQHDLAHLRSM